MKFLPAFLACLSVVCSAHAADKIKVLIIDGQNIAAVSRRSLRSQVAYVGQDVFLFRGSVRENIALGRLGASEAEVVAAAKAAYAHDFITAFPRGYDTQVGEHGLQVAGGERQRLSIARALVRKPDLYLFDDSLSALDMATDARLRAALAPRHVGGLRVVLGVVVQVAALAPRAEVLVGAVLRLVIQVSDRQDDRRARSRVRLAVDGAAVRIGG